MGKAKKFQSIQSKLGEVKFRKRLILQHTGKKTFYQNEPSKAEIITILKERADESLKIFKKLRSKNIPLSPFLEIGAEKCQRSAVLVTHLGANGVALDISAESLASASYFCPKIGLTKLPLRICGDAYKLPFKNNSLPFVFVFQALHHFPDPTPVTKEVFRVLVPGGYFYVGEEPVSQKFNLPLWHRDFRLRWWEKILKAMFILPFFSKVGRSEVSEGVLEESFDLATWQNALKNFEKVEINISPFPFGPSSKSLSPNFLTRIFLFFFGGGITALCRKNGVSVKRYKSVPETLKNKEKMIGRNGILYTFQNNIIRLLYPEIK